MGIWSEEAVSQLRSLAEQGLSAAQAASQIDGMSRNAACGVAFRHKFHFTGGNGGGPNHLAADAKPKRGKMVSLPKRSYRQGVELIAAVSAPTTPTRNVSIMELNDSTCRFPIGDPLDANFRYCGAKPHPSYPYCQNCCILAYEQPEKRHDRTESRGPGFYRRSDHQVRNGRAY